MGATVAGGWRAGDRCLAVAGAGREREDGDGGKSRQDFTHGELFLVVGQDGQGCRMKRRVRWVKPPMIPERFKL